MHASIAVIIVDIAEIFDVWIEASLMDGNLSSTRAVKKKLQQIAMN